MQFVSKQPAVEQHYHPTGIPSVFFFSIFWLLFLACCFCLFCFASHQLFRQTSGTLSDYLLDFLHALTASSVNPCLRVSVILFVWSAVAWKVVAVRTTLVWSFGILEAASVNFLCMCMYVLLCDWVELYKTETILYKTQPYHPTLEYVSDIMYDPNPIKTWEGLMDVFLVSFLKRFTVNERSDIVGWVSFKRPLSYL